MEFRMRVAHVTQYLIRWTVPIFLPFRKEKFPFRISASSSRLSKWLIKRLDRQPRYLTRVASWYLFSFSSSSFFYSKELEEDCSKMLETNILLESFNFPRSLELFDRKVRGNILK